MAKIKTFGWDAVKLSDLSLADLNELRIAVEADPASVNPDHANGKSIYLFTTSARRKLDALGWAVFHNMKNARKAA